MRYLFILAFLFTSQTSLAAQYICDPQDIRLTQDGSEFHLTGTLEVPSPGYTYDIDEARSQRSDLVQFPLTLTPPENTVPAVVQSVPIIHHFKADKNLLRVTISIDKDFNWGPDIIDCRIKRK